MVRFLEEGPSVIQVRTQDVLPAAVGSDVVRVLREHRAALDQGAIVSIDELASRVPVLAVRRR
jgi:predicted nuclease of predicted toxin-antitoxin system